MARLHMVRCFLFRYYGNPEYTKVEVAKALQVSRHTLWRALGQEATS